MLRILVLGSAAGGGFPQWNANSEACKRARRGEVPSRSQSSLAVTGDGRHWFLLNASPDLRQQINDNVALHPRDGIRHSPIAGVVLTNADVDHVAGLLTLREAQPLTLYATERVLGALAANSIFDVLDPEIVDRVAMQIGRPFAAVAPGGTDAGLRIEAFAVPGKVARYLEDADAGPGLGSREGDTVGLRVASAGSSAGSSESFFYVPGCAAMTPELADRLRGAALVFFDGTLFRDDEMIVRGEGAKTGARMGHMSMSGPDGTMAAFEGLGVRRRVFIHVNNTNPALLEDTPERRQIADAGWEVAWDGMEIEL
ncbi:MAG: pyrroloquinoline quinone biosynthesis protein PqqB [Rhodospirillales bacterium]